MNKKYYIHLLIFIGFVLFLAPIPFQTNAQEVCIGTNGACESKAQCQYNVELRCKLRCGTGSEGQDCKDTVNSIICVDVMWPSQTSTTIEYYIDNDYVPANQQDCAAGISIFANENECEQYCGVVCLDFCPNDMGACGSACVSSMCSGGIYTWDEHTNTSNFSQIAIDWASTNPSCSATTTGDPTIGEGTTASATLDNPISATSVPEIVVNVIQVLLTLLGSAALLIFIYGGIMMITSAGNEEKLKKARSTLVWAILGLVIILVSYGLMSYVFGIFTG